MASDAATGIFNPPDYRVGAFTVLDDSRRPVLVEPTSHGAAPPAVLSQLPRLQRIRDRPVAGAVEALWSKYRWHCEERACLRLSSF